MKNLKKFTMIVLLAALICAIPGGNAVGNVVAWAFETSPFFGASDSVYYYNDYYYADDYAYSYDDYYYYDYVDDYTYSYDDYYYVDEYVYSDYDYYYDYVDDYVYEDYDYVDEYIYADIDYSIFNGLPDTVFALTIGNRASLVFSEIKLNDVSPLLVDGGRTMLPARFIAENLGATVEWDEFTKTVIIKKDYIEIKITIGSQIATVNGVEHILDVPAFIQEGRTYTPVRFIAENLGATVDWNNDLSMVIITK